MNSEFEKQRYLWLKLIDLCCIKSFVSLVIAENEKMGARSLLMGVGLGGMVPNIVLLGEFNLKRYEASNSTSIDSDLAYLMPLDLIYEIILIIILKLLKGLRKY